METAPPPLNRSVSGPARVVQGTSRQYSTASTSSKVASMGRFIRSNTANFFGLGGDGQPYNENRWASRRDRLLSKKYGRLKVPGTGSEQGVTMSFDDIDGPSGPRSAPVTSMAGPLERMQSSTTSVGSYKAYRSFPRRKSKRESALKVAHGGFSTMVKSSIKRKPPKLVSMNSRTYSPASYTTSNDTFVDATIDRKKEQKVKRMMSVLDEDLCDEVFFDLVSPSVLTEPCAYVSPEIVPFGESQSAPMLRGWRRKPPQPIPSITAVTDEVDGQIIDDVMDKVVYNSDRRQFGKGLMGRLLNTTFKRMDSTVSKELDVIEDVNFRPYFTYWITFVQIVIYIVSICVYGIAPVGFSQTFKQAEVLTPRLAIEKLSRIERDNLWIGPRPADLIHLGAKYSPCMRRDSNVHALIEEDRKIELEQSGCCVRNDGAGCYQTLNANCSATLSTFVRYLEPFGKWSGAVCGQDPKYCTVPASVQPFHWSNNISEWPICRNTTKPDNKTKTDRHMSCEVVGHPCCVGIRGKCIITTREHCDFLRGYFHEDAFICSQVNCLIEICGMIPFGDPNSPDQFYRLIASLFLHAGLLHLIFSILFQLLIMRDLEKMIGPIRTCSIYFGSGIAGNLASAIFLPYLAEAGPSGCQFGILACLVGEYVMNWRRIVRPWIGFLKLAGLVLFLFLLGLLPWIDNYAHLIGFLFGFLLAFIFLPYLSFGDGKTRRVVTFLVCLILVIALFVVLILLFYVTPIYDCPNCSFFTCIPITPTFCQNMAVEIKETTQFT